LKYLLDTNLLSELRKIRLGRADGHVARWADAVDTGDLFLSVVTIQELEIGVLWKERQDATQGAVLRSWLQEQVLPAFQGRILPVDFAIAQRSGRLHVPDPVPFRDGLIAATALVHGMTVVTRNTQCFEKTGVALLNPWLPPTRKHDE